jgi:hypothetical protein
MMGSGNFNAQNADPKIKVTALRFALAPLSKLLRFIRFLGVSRPPSLVTSQPPHA